MAQEGFNHCYCRLLQQLDEAFNGSPQKLATSIGGMRALKAQAQRLMQLPDEGGSETAGPTFEYVDPGSGSASF